MDTSYILLFARLSLFILLHNNTSLANISTDEAALLALKSHISSHPNNILASNWSSSGPVCSWIGVTCSSRHNRVAALDISSMQLHGTIPPHLGNLSFLVSLNISNNAFQGDFPLELAHLQKLKLISVTSNNFTGAIPSFLSLLPNLRFVYLSSNQLSGEIPSSLSNLTKLQVLRMHNNFLQGEIPREIGDLRYLTILDLEYNQVSGSIPPSIFNLTTMQVIALTNNNLTGKLPTTICDHLPNLKRLLLSKNSLHGVIPPNLEKCRKLQILALSFNEFIGIVPRELANLTALTELYLGALHLEGEIPREISDLHYLTILDLQFNQLSGSIPLSIFNITTMQIIALTDNNLTGMLPTTICDHLPNLKGLYLSKNSLAGVIPPNLEKCQKLQKLSLSYNEFIGIVPRELANLTALTELYLGPLHLEGEIPMELGNLKKLQVLRLNENEFTGSVPESIFNMSTLQFLALSENKLSGSFSMVYKGILKDGTLLAAKVFNVQLEGAFKSFDTECEILRNLRHRNLTKVITSCANLDFKALVLEYMPNGTLDKWLYSHNLFLNLLQRLDIMIDVASAMDYLHNGYSMPVVHCDLKPSNVLLDQEMVGHVSDFGIAKLLGEGEAFVQTRTISTIGYIAPEYGQDGIVSTSCDVYSFGILMVETFTRKRPSDDTFTGELSIQCWVSDSFPGEIHKVVDSNLVQPGDEQIDAKMQCLLSIVELALNCTVVTPEARISMKDALSTLKKIRLQFVNSLL